MGQSLKDVDLAEYIDHTLLTPIAPPEVVQRWCEEADRFKFAAVCVYPTHVPLVVELLKNKTPKVCTVIGFSAGATTSAVKLLEAQEAADNGATELDVVINLTWLRTGKIDPLHRELAEIVESTGQTVKAIIETGLLTDDEKRLAADVCMDAGVSYIKTSTGWNGGATVEDIQLLKEVTRGRVGLKASGGIRTVEQAIALIQAGATRLGTSRGVDLMRQLAEADVEPEAIAEVS